MLLVTPSAVSFGQQVNTVQIQTVTFDLINHLVTIVYAPQGAGPGQSKIITHAIPGALQTAIENHVQSAIETNEGFTAGTTTVQTP